MVEQRRNPKKFGELNPNFDISTVADQFSKKYAEQQSFRNTHVIVSSYKMDQLSISFPLPSRVGDPSLKMSENVCLSSFDKTIDILLKETTERGMESYATSIKADMNFVTRQLGKITFRMILFVSINNSVNSLRLRNSPSTIFPNLDCDSVTVNGIDKIKFMKWQF